MRTLILGGLLASAMLVPALAQTSPPPAPPEPAAQSTAPKAHGEMWRSSKLIGLNVYNDQDEKLGAISEILLEKSGKVDFVVIGVGGFLGIGQQDIMVEMSKLKFVDEPVRISTPPHRVPRQPVQRPVLRLRRPQRRPPRKVSGILITRS